jgi:hypothetical protein
LRRRSSDLLDVFRAPAAAPARPSKAETPNRRVRLALGATIATLSVLLVTVAVVGLSKKGTPSSPPPALASLRRGEWAIRAETPLVSSAGARDLRGLLPRELVGRFPELKDRLKLAPGETKASM